MHCKAGILVNLIFMHNLPPSCQACELSGILASLQMEIYWMNCSHHGTSLQLSTEGGDKSPKWWFWLVSWAKWHGLDLTRCLKPPEIFFDPQGGPGGGLRGAAGGPNFCVYSSSITKGSEMLWYWARGLKFWKSPTWDWKKYNERKILKKNWK